MLTIVAGDKARLMFNGGDTDAGVISCGQGIGLVHDIPTIQTLFDTLMKKAKKRLSDLWN